MYIWLSVTIASFAVMSVMVLLRMWQMKTGRFVARTVEEDTFQVNKTVEQALLKLKERANGNAKQKMFSVWQKTKVPAVVDLVRGRRQIKNGDKEKTSEYLKGIAEFKEEIKNGKK